MSRLFTCEVCNRRGIAADTGPLPETCGGACARTRKTRLQALRRAARRDREVCEATRAWIEHGLRPDVSRVLAGQGVALDRLLSRATA
jgi:hypothetical protein